MTGDESTEADLTAARHAVHAAAQIPAATAHAVAPRNDDFSHTTLRYAPALGALVGVTLGAAPIRLAVRLRDVSVLVLGADDTVKASVVAEGKTLDRLRADVLLALSRNGVEAEAPWLTHDMPAHPLFEGATFPAAPSEGLRELEAWFARAEAALNRTRAGHPAASPVRCWPHHFDTAILIPIDDGGGETARSVGVGMSPGDAHLPSPYWYVSPWPPPEGELPPLTEGRWHRQGFTAAVLDTRGPEVDSFLDAAVQASLTLLQPNEP